MDSGSEPGGCVELGERGLKGCVVFPEFDRELDDGRPDLKAGKQAWSFRDRNFPYFSSPAVARDRVVFGGRDKFVHCVKREDGTPLWSFATRGKVDSSPVICGGQVVVGSDDGRLYFLSLDQGKELWSYDIGQPVESSPAITDGRVVIGADDGNVYCFGAKK